eukprot:scaffold109710_cov19-Tisochrysis_lutea.AAC.1
MPAAVPAAGPAIWITSSTCRAGADQQQSSSQLNARITSYCASRQHGQSRAAGSGAEHLQDQALCLQAARPKPLS